MVQSIGGFTSVHKYTFRQKSLVNVLRQYVSDSGDARRSVECGGVDGSQIDTEKVTCALVQSYTEPFDNE